MSAHRNEDKRLKDRAKVLNTAARLFLENGYEAASVRQIAAATGINVNTMVHDFGAKENILCELVKFVLNGQFSVAKKMLAGMTNDKVLYYAAETALQLYMAEHSEAVRNLYYSAYSIPASKELIMKSVSEKMTSNIFQQYLPGYTTDDFYQLEIASGSIICGYMTAKCSDLFPMDQKVERFLETSLRIYRVPEEKIAEAKMFVKNFDYPIIAKRTIEDMLVQLEAAFEYSGLDIADALVQEDNI